MIERPKLHLNWPAGERLSEQRKDSGTRDLAATPLVELDSGAELLHSLVRADGSKLSIPLGPAEAVAVDLIQAGRLPMGRTECGGRPQMPCQFSTGTPLTRVVL